MDDFGQILYIVIMIFAAIVGAVRNSQKKKEAQRRKQETFQQDESVTTDRETYIETIFERLEKSMKGEEYEKPAETILSETGYEEVYHEPEYNQEYTEPVYEPSYKTEKAGTEYQNDNPYQSLNEMYIKEQFYDKEKYGKRKYLNSQDDTNETGYLDKEGNMQVFDMDEKSNLDIRNLFNSPDDIKKAIILYEIMGRKFQ